jgi:hypothetical protein
MITSLASGFLQLQQRHKKTRPPIKKDLVMLIRIFLFNIIMH